MKPSFMHFYCSSYFKFKYFPHHFSNTFSLRSFKNQITIKCLQERAEDRSWASRKHTQCAHGDQHLGNTSMLLFIYRLNERVSYH